jgi:hypothetical protein
VAAYLSGSRVFINEPLSAELAFTLLLVIATFALLFALAFAFEFAFFGGTHANTSTATATIIPNPDRYLICRITHLLPASSGATL